MGSFTKTLIVDCDNGPIYTIKKAVDTLAANGGGTVIVESGVYYFDERDEGSNLRTTVHVPSNIAIIGRGNVEIRVTNADISAFRSLNLYPGQSAYNENITISGFKIVVACESGPYNNHLIFMQNVSNCVIEKITIDAPVLENPFGVSRSCNAIAFYSRGINCSGNIIRHCMIMSFGIQHPGSGAYNYGNGIYFSSHPGTDKICCDSLVINNHISKCFFNMVCAKAVRISIKGNVFSRAIGHYYRGDEEVKALNISFEMCNSITVAANQCNGTDRSTGSHGIYPSGCEFLIVVGNVFSENALHGIKPRFCIDNTVQIPEMYDAFFGNICNNNGKKHEVDITQKGVGIFLQGKSEHISTMGNIAVNNSGCGIRISNNDHEDPDETLIPAKYNNVIGNIAVLHKIPNDGDAAISVDINKDDGNNSASNLIGQLK